MFSASFGIVSLYFLVNEEGTYYTIFPVFVLAVSMCCAAANKFCHLLLKSVPNMDKSSLVQRQQRLYYHPSLFLRFQCIYFVVLNIPSCFIGIGIDNMLLAFGAVFGLVVLEKGYLSLSLQLHILEKLTAAETSTVLNSGRSHSSRIRRLKLIYVACVFLVCTTELSCGLVAVWRRIQLPSTFLALLIGFSGNFTSHVLLIIFPPKAKHITFKIKLLEKSKKYQIQKFLPNKQLLVPEAKEV